MAGRFVTIVIPGTRKTLTLCEVEVYGVPEGGYVCTHTHTHFVLTSRLTWHGCTITFAVVILSFIYFRDPSAKCCLEQNRTMVIPEPIFVCQ